MDGNPLAAVRRLQEVEDAHGLLDHEFDGWAVWPLFRFDVALEMIGFESGFQTARRPWRSYRCYAAAGLRDLLRAPALRPSPHAFWTKASYLTEPAGDRFRDTMFDGVLGRLGDYFKLVHVGGPNFGSRIHRAAVPHHLTTTAFEALARAGARLGRPRVPAGVVRGLAATLRERIGVTGFGEERIVRTLRTFWWARRNYARLLELVRPRILVLGEACYCKHSIVAAARSHGIVTAECQHGLLDPAGYSWSSRAAVHRSRMPIPDLLFLYGQEWKDRLVRQGFWEPDALRVVGSPRLDGHRSLPRPPRDGPPRILVTTQGLETARLVGFLDEFACLAARERFECRIDVKLHPWETSDEPYRLLRRHPSLRILPADALESVYDLLRRSDLHASLSSACHYEALALGVPTAILPLRYHEYVLDLVEAGEARIAGTPADLLDVARASDRSGPPEGMAERYFRTGAVRNMTEAILAPSY